MRVVGRARPRRRPRARRAPVPLHGLAHGARRGARSADAGARARDLDAAAPARASWKAASRKPSASTVPLGGAPFADDTAPRDALVAVPLPPGSGGRVRRGGRACAGSSASRCSRRGPRPARCRAGARRSRSARPLLDRMPRVPAGRRAARDAVGRARVPRARRVVVRAGRRARVAARERRRVRRQGRTRPRRARRASSPTGSAGRCASSTRAKTSCGSVRSARRSRRRRGCARRRRRDRRRRRARRAPRPRGVADARPASRSGRAGPRSTSPARRSSADLRAVGLAEQAVLVEGALARPVSTDRAHRRSDAARHVRGRAVGRERGRACTSTRQRCARRVEVRVAAGDPLDEIVLRSYAIGAAHMALGWVCTESLAVDPDDRRGARPHDPLVRHHPPEGHAAGRRRADRRRSARRSRAVVRRGVRRGRGRGVERARVAEGERPDTFPARRTRTARRLRR